VFGLGHLDLFPLIYGLVVFIGLCSIWAKLSNGKILSAAAEIGVFILVFKLHGGSVAGSCAAAIASLLTGILISWKTRS
jgi:hypothetical protein